MAYMLTAVITGPDVVEKIASNLSGGHHVELTAELALVPIAGTSGQNFGDEQPLLLEQAFPSRSGRISRGGVPRRVRRAGVDRLGS
jgi:hypothetical protein